HLTSDAFDSDRDEVMERARTAGVTRFLCVADEYGSSRAAAELALAREGVWASAGVHPHHARTVGPELESTLKGLLDHPKVVAVGEIGLDYHYDFAPVDVQHDVFRRQIRIAKERGLPLIIHNREAGDDVLRILKEEGARDVGGVLHCFMGDLHTAWEAIELGFYLGVGGPVTFKRMDDLRATLKELPLEKMVVETDAPYLAPVPHRGKRNEPAFTRLSAERLAELKEVDLATVADR